MSATSQQDIELTVDTITPMNVLTREQLPPTPDRDLTPAELRVLAEGVAASGVWKPWLDHTPGERHYVNLHRDEHIDVWLLCWNTADDTGWHDHDLSSGAVAVAQGEIIEGRLRLGQDPIDIHVAEPDSFCFGPERIHAVRGAIDGSASIHCYSPPLNRLGQFTVDEFGAMQRVLVSYRDELRPDR